MATTDSANHSGMTASRWRYRLMWLMLYWLGGVAVMAIAAFGLRWVMAAVGLAA